MTYLNQTKSLIVTAIALVLVSSCTPSPKERKHEVKQPNIGQNKQIGDAFNKASKNFNAVGFTQLLEWNGTFNSADVFRSVKDLHNLAEDYEAKDQHEKAEKLFNNFYVDGETHTTQPLIYSNYFKAAMGVADKPLLNALKENLEDLITEQNKIDAAIERIDIRPLEEKKKTIEKFDIAMDILTNFSKTIKENQDIYSIVRDKVSEGTVKYVNDNLKPLRGPLALVLDETKDLETTANATKTVAELYNVEIDSADLTMLNRIYQISPAIEAIKRRNPQSVLTALVKLWQFLSPQDRVKTFKNNKELEPLYKFFSEADAGNFRCLTRETDLSDTFTCGYSHTAKQAKIFPAIRRSGTWKQDGSLAVKAQIKDEFRKRMVGPIESEILKTLADLPNLIRAEVFREFEKEKKDLQRGQVDLAYFAKSYVNDFERKSFAGKGSVLFENSKVDVQGSLNSHLSIMANKVTYESNYSAETHGLQLQAMARRWDSQREKLFLTQDITPHRLEVISALNKILSLGGFKTQGARVVEGLYTPVNGGDNHSLNKIGSTDSLFGMQKEYSFSSDAAVDKSITVGNQAGLIAGLSQMIQAFKDYQVDKNGKAITSQDSIDDSLSRFTAKDIIAEVPGDVAQTQLFPRPTLFALIVGQTAALLKGIQTPNQTPIAMIFEDTKDYHWLNNGKQDRQATIAGLVDWKQGERSKVINTKDVAEFVIALGQFYDVTRDLEHTSSTELTDSEESTDDNGVVTRVNAIELINRNREQLKILVLGLTNFLIFAHSENGALVDSYNLDTKQKSEVSKDLGTYMRTMAAFKTAKDLLNKDDQSFDETVYATPISRLLNHMNQTMWDPAVSFYRGANGAAKPHEVYESLSTLVKVRDLLDPEVQTSLNSILEKWVGSLRN